MESHQKKSNSILYVTSVNKKLYQATGHKCISSFLRYNTEGDLLVTYEGDIPVVQNSNSYHVYNLDNDKWLKDWTDRNKDIIPPEYGGECTSWGQCKWGTNFNRQAARWFRKIASLKHAVDKYGSQYDAIILMDCDTFFLRHLKASLIFQVFGDNEVFYHLGMNRRRRGTGVEAGFMGFRKTIHGFPFLQEVFRIYDCDEFKQYERWDDGYVFRMVLAEVDLYTSVDVVKPHIEQVGAHVIIHGPFAKYITHNKGIHQKMGLVTKNE